MSTARPATTEDIGLDDISSQPAPAQIDSLQVFGLQVAAMSDTAKLELDEFNIKSKALVDLGRSRIFGKHTYVSYLQGQNYATKSRTDDKAIVGYTSQGLPFQIILNGVNNNDEAAKNVVNSCINHNVVPLIDAYAEKLSACDSHENALAIIKELIKEINTRTKKYRPAPVFAMSLGITYAYHDHLYFAGFGIGDTGLVLQKVVSDEADAKGELKQLAYTTHLSKFDGKLIDAFGAYPELDAFIARNSIFNIQVAPGDEILGYTYLMPELFDKLNPVEIQGERVCPSILSAESLNQRSQKSMLFDSVKEAICNIFEELCENAERDQLNFTIARDVMLSSITIPKPDTRKDVKERIFKNEMLRLKNLIDTLHGDFKEKATNVYNKASSLAKSEDLTEIIRDISACNLALEKPTEANLKTLNLRANKAHQFPSQGRMLLSAGLVLLGLALMLVGTMLILGGAALLPTGILSAIGVGGMVGGGITIAAGASLASTGLGIYANGYRGRALTKLKDQLVEDAKHQPTR